MAAGFRITDVLNNNSKAGQDESPKASFRTKDISIFKMYRNEANFYEINNIEDLASKILMSGLMENLVIVYDPCVKGEYRIISGERRWEALKLLVLKGYTEFETATCQIRAQTAKQEEAIELIIGNSHRVKSVKEELEEAKALKENLEYLRDNNKSIKGYDLSNGRLRDIVAAILQTNKTKIGQIDNINRNLIPEFLEETKKERISFSAANELAGMKKEKQQELYGQYKETGSLTYTEVADIKEELKEQQEFPEESKEEKQPPEEVRTQPEEPKELEETKGQQKPINPEPLNMTSKCYSCTNWNDCTERNTTVTACNEFKNKNTPPEKWDTIKQSSHLESIPVPPERVAQVHDIKIAHMFFDDASRGIKPFELRKKERDYKIGDTLHQMEYKDGEYTGRELYQEITYVLEDYTGLKEDYCIMGVKNI